MVNQNTKTREALIFDCLELLRPVEARKIVKLIIGETFSVNDFVVTEEGFRWVNPQLSRKIVRTVANLPAR